MSRTTGRFDPSELSPQICELCGCEITQADQECVAVDEGVSVP